MADVTDKKIGGFRILAEIKGASGSQGQVFKAVCENPPFAGIKPGTVVALKAMAVHDEDGQAWAKLEKRTSELVRLSHPNIVKYYGCFSESGTFNDTHAIVQEFLEGETLKQRLARCPSGLDADEALHVTEAALAGLAYTAANGIVHRDIKPANIFLCLGEDGAIVGVKLIDFEIARQEGGTTTSASGNLVGSFDYMSPDFTNSTFRGDEQSDVFSMGVVMHEAITGRTPYQRIEGSSGRADFAFLSRWARLHVDGTNPIRISSRANRLLAHSDEVLEKALAPLPQDRYASFAEFHAGLKVIRYRDIKNGDKAYRILQFIGKGGFGEVFKARVKGVGHFVAIKHLLKETYAERFYREAKIMSRLDDPCFVHFVDFFVVHHAGRREAFLVMDFLPGMPGSSLRDAIKRAGGAPLPYRETMLAFARFAHGLCVLHARGIFHRDIKPSNLYIPENHPERAVIMDLGIARDVHGSITTGQVPGTLDYMPPEVVLTENRGEAGMDIYALGLCLYEALSGKTAFPRLPQGAAAITAFLARANIKAMPDLSDPSVMENAPLHELLVRMTHPELSERITDTSAVERALADLAGVEQMPTIPVAEEDVPPVAEEDGTKTRDGFGAAVEVETRPPQDNPYTVNADPKTIKTFETIQQTMQTKPPPPVLDIGRGNEVEDQPGHERRGRFLRGLALAAVAVVACLGAVWACRGWFVADAAVARKEAEAVVRMYAGRGLEDGRVAKEKWLKRWTPRQGDWVVDLDGASFAACTNRIHAEEVKILDVAAESAAVEVESSYSNTKNATAECDRMFEEWRKEWAQQCSSAKFSELEGRIRKNAQYGRYRRAGIQLTLSYPVVTNTLEACDRQAERWKRIRPDGFPDDEFSKLASNVDKARTKRMETDRKREEERVRENDRRAAESALEEVVKSYAAGTAVGDREAVTWRKNWKEKLDDRVYSEMDAQIATTRTNRADIERRQRIQAKKKEFEADCRRIAAGYRDDSSDKAKADAEYDEWVKKWHADRDVPADWRTRLEENVKNEKAAREKRIALADEKVKAAAGVALQEVIQAYDTGNEIGVGDEKAEDWRQAWKEKLPADAYSQMNVQIVSAREKRVNHDEWEKKQRILASKTNEVESVRVALVKDYGNDSGAKKADIDSRFDRWATNWEADEVLRKELPNWFAGRKRTVEEAKKACEARIAEEKRNQLVAAKTNDVVTVRLQLEGAYKTDTSDKATVDRRFTDWMLKWSADADLPPGWFADQMKPVEREKSAREDRDERKRQEQRAGDEAESVCETYRADGVAVGDGSRKMWNNSWTNTLELAVFLTLSEKIGKAREARVQADEAEAERLKAARAAAQRKADKNRAEEVVARQKAERERERRFSDKTNKVVSVRTQLVNGYKTDASDKARLDKDFTEWVQAWQADAGLPPGWFVEQRLAVEREKLAREGRDVVAQQALQQAAQIARQKEQEAAQQRIRASDQAESVCKSYQRFGVVAGDGNRDLWSSTWTNVLDAAVFRELSEKIGKARADRRALDDERGAAKDKARIREKQNRARSVAEDLVRAYENVAIARTETDRSFAAWRDKWSADTDLSADWLSDHRKKVETAQADRIARDAAEKNRKDAWDDVVRVREKYASGVENGDSERQIWEGKWKPVLDEATYKNISAIIDKDHKKAVEKAEAERKKAEEERRKAERERLEKDIRAKLSVDRDHVERWKGQLADAEQQIAKGKASGVLDAQNAATLQDEIDQRKKWVVGVVANQSQQEIDVAKRRVAPGQHECFVLEEGMPAGGLQVTCEGYKPLVIDEAALDGEIVAIGSGKWTLVPVPKARVQVPALEDGVACLVDGRERSGEFELASGGHAYVYRLAGHEDQKGAFSVKAGEVMKLPVPGEWRADKTLEDAFTRNLKDVERCLDVDDGDLALGIYHKMLERGYRLTEDDRANVEQAYEICKEAYAEKLKRARKDPRFDEDAVRKWWEGVLRLYNDLTSKK